MTIIASLARCLLLFRGRPVSGVVSFLVVLAIVSAAADPMAAGVISIGHRGDSTFAPENTVAAFESAYGKASAVEFDVRETSDGHLILMHDGTVDRTTDGAGAVSGMTLAQLQALDAGAWFDPQFAGEPVPTLDQAITAILAGGMTALVERKTGSASLYVDALQSVKDSVEIHSFSWSFLSDVHALDSQLQLTATGSGLLEPRLGDIPAGVSRVSWRAQDLTAANVQAVHDAGMELYAWTVNNTSDMQAAIALGVDGIMSDNPGLLTQMLQGGQPALADGLRANWKLDDGLVDPNTTTAMDSVNGNDATLGGFDPPPSWLTNAPPAKLDGGLSFDGIDDHALVPQSPSLDMHTNAVTVSAWVKLDELPSLLLENFGGIYDSVEDSYVVYLDRGNAELRFKVTDSNGTAARPGIPETLLDTTDWHHVAGVYDGGAGVARIYFDGELIDMHADDGGGSDDLVDMVKNGQTAAIGRNGADAAYFFPGDVDDVAVWDRALSEAEVRHLYNGGDGRAVTACSPVVPAVHPVVYLPMDGDLTNHGTGGSTVDGALIDGFDGTNAYVPGEVGQALDLENPDAPTGGDYVSIPYTLTDKGTIALWYYAEDFYNYQTIFDNSIQQDDWEMWIYESGLARFRIEGGAQVDADLESLGGPDNWYHLAMTWVRADTNVVLNLYVDGQLRDVDEGAWIDPGDTFFLGGGHELNDHGNGIWDELLIYDTVLNSEEIMRMFQDSPVAEPSILVWDGQGDGNWADVEGPTCHSRWVDSAGKPVLTYPDASINALVHADTVTMAQDQEVNSLTASGATVAIGTGQTLDVSTYIDVAADATLILDGELTAATGAIAGTLAGSGTINVDPIEVAGSVAPGTDGVGTLTVDNGELVFGSGAAYNAEVSLGDGSAIAADKIVITGAGGIYLDGKLAPNGVGRTDAGFFSASTTLTVVDNSAGGVLTGVSGDTPFEFAAVDPTPAADGSAHIGQGAFLRDVIYDREPFSTTAVKLHVFVALGGDADGDKKVWLSDWAALRANFGNTATDKTWTDGNFDPWIDGKVWLSDWAALRATFGNADYTVAEAGAAAVPEPGTIAMLLAALAGLTVAAWRRR